MNPSAVTYVLSFTSMAIVVASPAESRFNDTTNDLSKSKLDGSEWYKDFLHDAACRAEYPEQLGKHLSGVRIVSPVGIVTYKNLVDLFLRKTPAKDSLFPQSYLDGAPRTANGMTGLGKPLSSNALGNEKIGNHNGLATRRVGFGADLRDRSHTQVDGASDGSVVERNKERNKAIKSQQPEEAAVPFQPDAILRKRNISTAKANPWNFDGANERNSNDDDDDGPVLHVRKVRATQVDSSYTDNSQGGFHHSGMHYLRDDVQSLTWPGNNELVEHAYLTPFFNNKSLVSTGSLATQESSDDGLR